MNWISTTIEKTIESLDQGALVSLVNHVKSGAVGIPHDIDRILLSEGRKHLERLLTEAERKDLRSGFADKLKHAKIENLDDDAFEFEGGGYKIKSSGSGNLITAVVVGGVLVLAGVAAAAKILSER